MRNLELTRTTRSASKSELERTWYLIDADGQVLGRLASKIAAILRGKNKVLFTPSIDTGDHIIVVNAEKVRLTGGKEDKKNYYHHSGYPGGLKEVPYRRMIEKKPEEVIIHAVRGMLPHNRLGRSMIKKLHVYAGASHPHAAQRPEPLSINEQK
ncbi:MAG: 50S ribosomal protein L13 [Actinomycetota bacterium]|nr:50S ribosomal protein L13 [Actinomycetota bacterium]